MANAYERHDRSDESWAKMELLLPGRKGTWGGNARDNRQFINAVFWILRMGAPWRDLPPSYGDWKNTHRRFCRWRDRGVREPLLEELIDHPEFKLLMTDAGHIKVHPPGSGARGGNQDLAKNPRGLNTRIHLAVAAHGMPVGIIVSKGTSADGKQAEALIDGIEAKVLLADRGYESDAMVEKAEKAGMKAVIPPRKNRRVQLGKSDALPLGFKTIDDTI